MGKSSANSRRRRPTARKKAASRKKRAGRGFLSKFLKTGKKAKRKTTARKSGKPRKKRATRRVAKRKVGRIAKPFWENIDWQTPQWLKRFFRFSLKVASVSLTAILIGIIALVIYGEGLPRPDMQNALQRPPRITVVDKDGLVITAYGTLYGSPVDVTQLPPHVVQAFIATEDRNFYHHLGVNPVSIARAIMVNVKAGQVRQGGSTITQQVAKNLFLSSDRTLNRKAQEVLLSFWLELNYSKDEILALYLNQMYFGAGAFGLDAAAERYFKKSPKQLTIGEAAMLAGLLKAPSNYAPTSSPEAAKERAKIVLNAMFEAGYLTQSELDNIKTGSIAKAAPRDYAAAYAVDYAIDEATGILGTISEDVVIRTTLDLSAHQQLETSLKDLTGLQKPVPENVQIAMIALERDGAIRVLIGGRDYAQSEYNRAAHASRQPGSAFKPFIYLAAMEDGMRPDDMVIDAPIELDKWRPANYKNRYYGAVTLTEAMSRSLNAAAIILQETVGRDKVIALANRFGFGVSPKSGPAMALGVFETTPLNLAAAYASFAGEGAEVLPYTITEIETEQGRLLYSHQVQRPYYLSRREAIIALNHMLKATAETGSGFRAKVPGYATYGKTGTTQDSRDAWFAGHVGGLAGTVWVGFDNNAPMHVGNDSVSGSGAPAILWQRMMLAALDGRPDEPQEEWFPPQPKWRFPFPFLSENQDEASERLIRTGEARVLPDETYGAATKQTVSVSASSEEIITQQYQKVETDSLDGLEVSNEDHQSGFSLDEVFQTALGGEAPVEASPDPFAELMGQAEALPSRQAASTAD